VIAEALEEQVQQIDAFLEESRKREDRREAIHIVLRQADLQLLDQPMITAKVVNCTFSNDALPR
jgi:hypothetical protein